MDTTKSTQTRGWIELASGLPTASDGGRMTHLRPITSHPRLPLAGLARRGWLLPLLAGWGLAASQASASPQMSMVVASDATPYTVMLTYSTDEPVKAELRLYSDRAMTLESPGAQVSPRSFGREDVADRVRFRNLGALSVSNLTPNTTYYFQVELTAESDGEVTHWPTSGSHSFKTATSIDPLRTGQLQLGSSVMANVTLANTSRTGATVLLEVEGALGPLSAVVGESVEDETATFDLTNLYSQANGTELSPVANDSVVLTVIEGFQQVSRRGYRLQPAAGGMPAQLEGFTETIDFPQGWTFFGLPVELPDSRVEVALAEVLPAMAELWCYREDAWIAYTPNQTGGPLEQLEPLEGCAIRMNQAASWTVTGPRVLDPLWLHAGWQVTALPVLEEEPTGAWLESMLEAGLAIRIWGWNAESGGWEVYDTSAPGWWQDLENLVPGQAYHLALSADALVGGL